MSDNSELQGMRKKCIETETLDLEYDLNSSTQHAAIRIEEEGVFIENELIETDTLNSYN